MNLYHFLGDRIDISAKTRLLKCYTLKRREPVHTPSLLLRAPVNRSVILCFPPLFFAFCGYVDSNQLHIYNNKPISLPGRPNRYFGENTIAEAVVCCTMDSMSIGYFDMNYRHSLDRMILFLFYWKSINLFGYFDPMNTFFIDGKCIFWVDKSDGSAKSQTLGVAGPMWWLGRVSCMLQYWCF